MLLPHLCVFWTAWANNSEMTATVEYQHIPTGKTVLTPKTSKTDLLRFVFQLRATINNNFINIVN